MDAILDIIDDALKRKGLSDTAASRLAVGHPSLIKNLRMPREGEKRYNLPSLKRLAEVLDLELYFGPQRELPGVRQVQSSNMDPAIDGPGGFATIPWLGAGPGSGSAPIAFAYAWLRDNGLTPDFLQAVVPDFIALPDAAIASSLALIDTRIGPRKGHKLLCYRDAGRVAIGHITFRGDVTVVHPASTDQEPKVYDTSGPVPITLLGRVVWMGHIVPFRGPVSVPSLMIT